VDKPMGLASPKFGPGITPSLPHPHAYLCSARSIA